MISINLLPQRFRGKDRMPLGAFASLAAGVLLAFSAAGYYFYIEFGSLTKITAEREQIEGQVAALQPQIQYHTDLTAEAADYEKRQVKIREIGASRVLWTKKLDQLADIVNAGEDVQRYTVWFEEVEADQVPDTKGTMGGKFKAKGLSATGNYANMANFFQDLEGTLFFKDFIAINNPAGKKIDPEKDLIPSEAWEFNLNMALKPPPESSLNKKPVKKAPAKPEEKKGK